MSAKLEALSRSSKLVIGGNSVLEFFLFINQNILSVMNSNILNIILRIKLNTFFFVFCPFCLLAIFLATQDIPMQSVQYLKHEMKKGLATDSDR